MSEKERLEALAAMIATELKGAPERPRLRLVTTADLPPKPPRLLTDEDREWACREIRVWCSVYPIDPYVRRRMKGYALLEEMPDEELREVLHFVERCVQAIRDEVPFDEAGLL